MFWLARYEKQTIRITVVSGISNNSAYPTEQILGLSEQGVFGAFRRISYLHHALKSGISDLIFPVPCDVGYTGYYCTLIVPSKVEINSKEIFLHITIESQGEG